MWVIAVLAYIVYQCWSCAMPSSKYIANSVNLPQVYKDADHAINSQPEIKFHIECFHYENKGGGGRRRRRRKGKGG